MSTTQSSWIKPISRVSANGRYFTDAEGQPLFWLGDTQWELFRMFSPDEALHILRKRQAKGINIILIMLTGVDTGRFGPAQGAPYVNLEGESPWIDDDPLRPNERYFQHIDAIIRLGERTGQTFVVGIFHQWHVNIITVPKARAWARWVAQRYRDVPNLVWCMYPRATPAYVPVCRELATGLQEGDDGRHLITMHPDPSVASSSFMHDEPWLAFNMIQTCMDYDRIYEAVTADYGRAPVKPVIMAEGAYEGIEFNRLQTPHHIRKQAYWSQLAGGYHVYGHNDAWVSPRRWDLWLDAPGSSHLQVFREVITSCLGWWDLVPDPSLIVSGAGSGFALNVAARSAAGDWILAYLSEPSTIMLGTSAITASPRAKAEWIDPTTGARTPAGTVETGSVHSFTCPQDWEDALLYLEALNL